MGGRKIDERKGIITIAEIIRELSNLGFFDEWKTMREIYYEIEIVEYGTLYPAVLNCVTQGTLQTRKGEKVREFKKNE